MYLKKLQIFLRKFDSLQVNSQLLEAVQQKVSISQQLEDWETDLHLVIGNKKRSGMSSLFNPFLMTPKGKNRLY